MFVMDFRSSSYDSYYAFGVDLVLRVRSRGSTIVVLGCMRNYRDTTSRWPNTSRSHVVSCTPSCFDRRHFLERLGEGVTRHSLIIFKHCKHYVSESMPSHNKILECGIITCGFHLDPFCQGNENLIKEEIYGALV
jgi:hypothetical protein